MSAPFIQIATCAAENGHSLYALDAEGVVWEYHWVVDGGIGAPELPKGWRTLEHGASRFVFPARP